MKAGIAYTHDLGLQQDHRHHSFGNYITIATQRRIQPLRASG